MALELSDIVVVQKQGTNELRKASVESLGNLVGLPKYPDPVNNTWVFQSLSTQNQSPADGSFGLFSGSSYTDEFDNVDIVIMSGLDQEGNQYVTDDFEYGSTFTITGPNSSCTGKVRQALYFPGNNSLQIFLDYSTGAGTGTPGDVCTITGSYPPGQGPKPGDQYYQTLQDVTELGNDTTEGITIATDKIKLNKDGSATFDGNVGIGTDQPTANLHVANDVSPTINLERTGAGFDPASLRCDNGGRDLRFKTNQDYYFDEVDDTRMTIQAGGKVGIGTDSPQAPLQVIGNVCIGADGAQENTGYQAEIRSGGNATLKIQAGATNTTYLGFGTTSDALKNNIALNNSTGDLKISVNSDVRQTILSNGNVGIGTDSPSGKLDVQTGNNERVVFDSAGSTSPRISLTRDAGANYNFTNDLGVYRFYKNETIELYRYASDTHVWSTEVSGEVARFSSNGNVGIGDDNPQNKLKVRQSAVDNAPARNAALYLENNANCEIQMVGNSANNIQLRMGTSGNSFAGALDYSLASNKLDIFTNSTKQVTIDSSGNVGIGTDTPSEKLEVNGTIKSKYIDVTVAPNAGDAAYRSRLTGGANAFHMYCDMDGGGLIALRSSGQITAQGYDLEALPSLP